MDRPKTPRGKLPSIQRQQAPLHQQEETSMEGTADIDAILKKLVERSLQDKPDDVLAHMLGVLTEVEAEGGGGGRRAAPLASAELGEGSYAAAAAELEQENAWLRDAIAQLDSELAALAPALAPGPGTPGTPGPAAAAAATPAAAAIPAAAAAAASKGPGSSSERSGAKGPPAAPAPPPQPPSFRARPRPGPAAAPTKRRGGGIGQDKRPHDPWGAEEPTAAAEERHHPGQAVPLTPGGGGGARGGWGTFGTKPKAATDPKGGPYSDTLTILHFNDVYNIEGQEKEPKGGAARFATAIQRVRDRGLNPLVLFSGDAFAPSIMSTVVRGEQMPPCLNALGVHTACYGNHDFDFGLEALAGLAGATAFPWLISNAVDVATNRPLGNGLEYRVFEWAGHKVGLMGLIEREWLETLATIEVEEVQYTDFVEKGRYLERLLREQHRCELVVALTHMRVPNDRRLAEECPRIDLFLGGHDHHYEVLHFPHLNRYVFKSGTDFRELTQITLRFDDLRMARVAEHRRIEVDGSVPEDPQVKAIVQKYQALVGQQMDTPLGKCAVALDARFASIRTRETNVGNLVCDIIREASRADAVLLNAGTLRADCVFEPGPFKMRDLVQLLPMCDEMAVLRMPGAKVLAALENGVSMHPKLEGRFPQVSGISFTFDPSKPPGERVEEKSVLIKGEPLDVDKDYEVCVKQYLLAGRDGYTMFPGMEVLRDGNSLPALPTMVRNHFGDLARAQPQGPSAAAAALAAAAAGTGRPAPAVPARERRRSSRMSVRAKLDAAAGREGDLLLRGPEVLLNPAVEGRILNKLEGLPAGARSPAAAPLSPAASPKAAAAAAAAAGGGGPPGGGDLLTVLHFNDVYNVEGFPAEPRGGAARFKTAVQQVRDRGLNPLVLFSGDAFAPSIMSTVVKGKQMPPCLNALGIDVACYGNHDFDFGLGTLEQLAGETNFPWLISNAVDRHTNKPLGGGRTYRVLDWAGRRVGLMGLIEREWLETLATIEVEEVLYTDFVEKAAALEGQLRRQGCDLVIALTHMRVPNDQRLARECPQLDLILGGHDHHYEVIHNAGEPLVFKSGTDFKDLTQIQIKFGSGRPEVVNHERIVVDSKFEEDPEVKAIVQEFDKLVGAQMELPLGFSATVLDSRFSSIRTQETNAGNFVCDIVKEASGAEIVILNSGTLRADCLIQPGPFKMRDLMNLLPMCDEMVVIGMTGAQVLAALENGVSQYPRLEGRFPQVSGVRFAFDPDLEAGGRVKKGSVLVAGAPLEETRQYKVCIKGYLLAGKDGYVMFPGCPLLVDAEALPALNTMVRNHFTVLGVASGAKAPLDPRARRRSSAMLRDIGRQSVRDHIQTETQGVHIHPVVDGRVHNLKTGYPEGVQLPEAPAAFPATARRPKEFSVGEDITILHFNDVYNIEGQEKEPKGGVARFKTALQRVRDQGLNPLVLFSGDAFAPSIMSTVVHGKQMPPCLNLLGIHTACYGNHDFDFGLEKLEELAGETNFPWLMSNCVDRHTNKPLGGGLETRVFEWQGKKVGLIGLIEREWLETLATIEVDEVLYTDFVDKAAALEAQLRREDGCQLVIALTHMRVPNDQRLARECPQLDLILGGHDHHYEVIALAGQPPVVKSGTDFRDATLITVGFEAAGGKPVVRDHERIVVDGAVPEDAEARAVVARYQAMVDGEMDVPLGTSAVALDSRFASIRTMETNIGNLVADIINDAAKADITILNSGTLRADCVFEPGPFKMRDLVQLLPMCDEMAVIEMTGDKVLAALENGVSKHPRLEGRFPQVSGVTFAFDPDAKEGNRVQNDSLLVHGRPIDFKKKYKVCIKAYLLAGKDGYTMFPGCTILKGAEDLLTLPNMVRNHFTHMAQASGHTIAKANDASSRRQSSRLLRSATAGKQNHLLSIDGAVLIAPRVEGRIVNLKTPPAEGPPAERRRSRSVNVAPAPGTPAPGGGADTLTIVHFNDVYNVEGQRKEPVGGAARFATAVKQMRESGANPLVLFSGDAFNPSILSTIVKGVQMPPCLNAIGIHTACYGNHDFDFGLDALQKLAGDCNFPWLISNAYDKRTNKPLGNGQEYRVFEWAGHKIGLVGLIEGEWLETLGTVDIHDVQYVDFVEKGRALESLLRREGCEMVIALTHMRMPNDQRLAKECPQFDIILGGHDHHYEVCNIGGKLIFNSGTDFRDFSKITVEFQESGPVVVDHEHIKITSEIPEDPEVKQIVAGFQEKVSGQMEEVLVITETDLDGRFQSIRTKETNLGNFVTDVMRTAGKCDAVLLNAGTLRSDTVHAAGPFTLGDLLKVVPMCDDVCVLALEGRRLVQALENGVARHPALEGRFLQVSNVEFRFDPVRPAGQRVLAGSVLVGGQPLDPRRSYEVMIMDYLRAGRDGYTMFGNCPVLRDAEVLPPIPTMLRNHFAMLRHAADHTHTTDGHVRRAAAMVVSEVRAGRARHHSIRGGGGGGASSPPAAAAAAAAPAGGGAGFQVNICPRVEGRILNVQESGPGGLPSVLERQRGGGEGGKGELVVAHFCDVTDLEGGPGRGGLARFAEALATAPLLEATVSSLGGEEEGAAAAAAGPLVLFSGGAAWAAGSRLGAALAGRGAAPCLAALGVRAACFGAHDFDYGGLAGAAALAAASPFPWLLSNVVVAGGGDSGAGEDGGGGGGGGGRPPAGAVETHVLEWGGVKVGLIGIAGRRWLERHPCLAGEGQRLVFLDPVDTARVLARRLRRAGGCAAVLALTHQSTFEDELLAAGARGLVDAVLGGHDHDWELLSAAGTPVVKSGRACGEFTRLRLAPGGGPDGAYTMVGHEHVVVDDAFDANEKAEALLSDLRAQAEAKAGEAVATLGAPLKARRAAVRSEETAVGNLVADAARLATGADAAVLRAGALAADRDFPAGPLTVADMMELVDPVARETVCVVEVTGDKLLLALESCLSNAPEPDPSFPLLSNLSLAFDPARPALRRVDAAATLVAGGPLDRARTYAVAVSGLGPGAENYAGSRVAPGAASAWAGCPLRRQAKDLPPLGALLRRRLEALAREGGGQGLVLAPEGRILDRSGV